MHDHHLHIGLRYVFALLLWALLLYRAGIWTRNLSQLREIIETGSHGIVGSLLLALALGWSPHEPQCATAQHQPEQHDERTGNAWLIEKPTDLRAWDQSLAIRVINPLPQANEESADPKQNQRLPQPGIVANRGSTAGKQGRQNGQGLIPLVGNKPLEFIHLAAPLSISPNRSKQVRP